jgi:hypothetical protein
LGFGKGNKAHKSHTNVVNGGDDPGSKRGGPKRTP